MSDRAYHRTFHTVDILLTIAQDALAAKLAAEQQRYEELKAELQAWAAGLTVACLAATYAFYGRCVQRSLWLLVPAAHPVLTLLCPLARARRDVAASYGVGALGGLVYLRLLNSSVDSVGGGLGGALGQPRLLIPVILALGYNRWGWTEEEFIVAVWQAHRANLCPTCCAPHNTGTTPW